MAAPRRLTLAMTALLGVWLPLVLGQLATMELQQTVREDRICQVGPGRTETIFTQYMRVPHYELQGELAESVELKEELTSVLQRIFAHPLLLSWAQAQNGVATTSDGRVQRFVSKLVGGKAVSVVVLGGSTAAGHGVWSYDESWVARVFEYINATFPHPDHKLLNRAVPTATSSYITPCAYTMIPEDADLVLLEFTVADSSAERARHSLQKFRGNSTAGRNPKQDEPASFMLERLLREILELPGKPAVMYVHTWVGGRPDMPFNNGLEDEYAQILQYYGVTTFSFRNAVHDLLHYGPSMKTDLWADSIHYHLSCLGTRYLADLVIGHLMEQASQAAWRSLAAPSSAQLLDLSELPPAMFRTHEAGYSTQCIAGGDILTYVNDTQGFLWLESGTLDDPTPGLYSDLPGSWLSLKVPLDGVVSNGADIVIGFGMLMSWDRMGIARLTCHEGCSCEAREYSTSVAWAGINQTMANWRFIEAKVAPGSMECTIGISVQPQLYSNGHRAKVNSLLVSGQLSTLQASNAYQEGFIKDVPQPTRQRQRRSSSL